MFKYIGNSFSQADGLQRAHALESDLWFITTPSPREAKCLFGFVLVCIALFGLVTLGEIVHLEQRDGEGSDMPGEWDPPSLRYSSASRTPEGGQAADAAPYLVRCRDFYRR